MKKTLQLITVLALSLLALACEDNDDNQAQLEVSFAFTHNWDGTVINDQNLMSTTVTNQNGETMEFSRLRYLVSRFELVSQNGVTYSFDGYKFTDLSDPQTYNFTPMNNTIPSGNYTLRFVWGFNEADNIDGGYVDLNSASWNWPPMLGGGYHFLQFDGFYNVNTSSAPFNFHNGTARASTNPDVFEQNFAVIELPNNITITNNAVIEVEMNIAEFFKNPHQWDLNVLDTPLMPNYMAQKMMQDNVETVFSLGTITQ